MDQQVITRRKVLAAAGTVGAAAALTGVRGVRAASGESDDAVLGTWVVTVTSTATPPGQPPFTSIVGLATGGVLVTSDSRGPGNVSVGAWEHNGSHSFEAVFETFAFQEGTSGPTFVGTAIIHPKGTVSGDKIHGTYSVDFNPADTSLPLQKNVDHGTFAGSRLEP
jgi:hypothetical protein